MRNVRMQEVRKKVGERAPEEQRKSDHLRTIIVSYRKSLGSGLDACIACQA